MCQYRGVNNTKCAVGHLIDDAHYHEYMEDEGSISDDLWILDDDYLFDETPIVHTVIVDYLKQCGHDIELCIALQYVHDHYELNEWEKGFSEIAKYFKLDMP